MEGTRHMKQLPRIFVGTMYTQEGDFLHALERVQQQEGVVASHIIIANMREKEAHNALWHAWRHQGKSHDLFVKLDADTVLATTTTLAEIWQQFEQNPRVTGLQAPLHDYMTDGFINGLNAFSTKVVFNDTQDELYCDRQVDTGHDVVLRGDALPINLRPAGFHCHHASDKQAFHFGLHRALKGQRLVIDKMYEAWHKCNHDRTRAMGLIGAGLSSRFAINRRFNYADQEFLDAFEEASRRFDEFEVSLARGRPQDVK